MRGRGILATIFLFFIFPLLLVSLGIWLYTNGGTSYIPYNNTWNLFLKDVVTKTESFKLELKVIQMPVWLKTTNYINNAILSFINTYYAIIWCIRNLIIIYNVLVPIINTFIAFLTFTYNLLSTFSEFVHNPSMYGSNEFASNDNLINYSNFNSMMSEFYSTTSSI